jgi:hypothetical protein
MRLGCCVSPAPPQQVQAVVTRKPRPQQIGQLVTERCSVDVLVLTPALAVPEALRHLAGCSRTISPRPLHMLQGGQ